MRETDKTMLRLLRENKQLHELTGELQRRCTELLDVARANGRIAKATPGELHVLSHFSHERRQQDLAHGELATLLDVPMGTGEIWEPLLCRIRYESAQHVEAFGAESFAFAIMEEAAEFAAETDPKRMREELVQLGALACKVSQIIDMKAAT